jgi:uncharacterized protein (DUF2062 family)
LINAIIIKPRKIILGRIRKLLSLRASPHQIALGFAIGTFIGVFPTFGLGGLVIIAVAALWHFNVPAALLGTLMGNPLFATLWITLTCLMTGISPGEIKLPKETFREILAHYSQIGLKYLIGNFGLSIFVAVVSYFMLIRAVHWFRGRKKYKAPNESDRPVL